jgi:hypothetical protein
LDAVAVVEPSARQLPAAQAVHEAAEVKDTPPLEKVPAGQRLDELVAEPVPCGQKYPGGHAVCVAIVVAAVQK